MSWEGKAFIMQEEGNSLLLRALEHYKKKLKKIGTDPKIKEMGGSFAMILSEQSYKTYQAVDPIIEKIQSNESDKIESLKQDTSILESGLNAYKSDIITIEQTMKDRCHEVFDEPKNMAEDLPRIEEALEKIRQSN